MQKTVEQYSEVNNDKLLDFVFRSSPSEQKESIKQAKLEQAKEENGDSREKTEQDEEYSKRANDRVERYRNFYSKHTFK